MSGEYFFEKNIHSLLAGGFTPEELLEFIEYDAVFRPISTHLPLRPSLAEILKYLIPYARKKTGGFSRLLEWAKEKNPNRYELHQPYELGDMIDIFMACDSIITSKKFKEKLDQDIEKESDYAWEMASLKNELHILSETVGEQAVNQASSYKSNIFNLLIPLLFDLRWKRGYKSGLNRILSLDKADKHLSDFKCIEINEVCSIEQGVLSAEDLDTLGQVLIKIDDCPILRILVPELSEVKAVINSVNAHGYVDLFELEDLALIGLLGKIPIFFKLGNEDELVIFLIRNRRALIPLIARLGMPGSEWFLSNDDEFSVIGKSLLENAFTKEGRRSSDDFVEQNQKDVEVRPFQLKGTVLRPPEKQPEKFYDELLKNLIGDKPEEPFSNLRSMLEAAPKSTFLASEETIQNLFKDVGFELNAREIENPDRIMAIPKNEVWKQRFEKGVYIEIASQTPIDMTFIHDIKTRVKNWNPEVKYALLITEHELEDECWSMIHTLAVGGFTIVPVPIHLFSITSSQMDSTTLLLKHIDKRLGIAYDPYKETGAVYGAGNFFGRVSWLNKLEKSLLRGKPQALFGIRKLGKSSILYHLATKIRLPVAVIDLQGGSTQPFQIYNRMLAEWGASVKKKFNINWASPQVLHHLTNRDSFKQAILDLIRALEPIMDDPRLAVFVDEIELLVPNRNETDQKLDRYMEIMETIRALSEANILSILVASLSPALTRISHWASRQNPAYQLFDINYLDPLTMDDCTQMIRNLGHQVQLKYDQQDIDLIYKASGGHPFITRKICSLAYEQYGHQRNEVPFAELLRKVIEEFIYEPNTASLVNRDGLWGMLTESAVWGEKEAYEQGELLRFLASNDPLHITEFIRGKDSANKQTAVKELKNLSIIQEFEPEYYDITIGLFKDWIREWAP